MLSYNASHDQQYAEVFQRNIGVLTEAEQEKLRQGTVLVAGLGGVGGPTTEILVRLGVGRLIISDLDAYSLSNLNRQLPSQWADVGRPKVEVVAAHLRAIHPFTEIVPVPEGISGRNVDQLVRRSDVVVSSMDSCMTMVLQQALKRNNVMGLTASPMFHHITGVSFPPHGHYFADIYPFEIDEENLEASNQQYLAWVEVLTGRRFRHSHFPVISAGTFTAAGLIAHHVVYYLAQGRVLLPPFPQTLWLDTRSMRMRVRNRFLTPLFGLFRLLPFTRRLFVNHLQARVLRNL